MLRVTAVDLGASAARVAVVDLDRRPPSVDVVLRHAHGPVPDGRGRLRWDWDGLVDAVLEGLGRASASGPIAALGIDTWAVDYGLLDGDGRLLSPPFSYRDARVSGWRDVARRLGERRLYRTTGIQLMPINTVFQLAAHEPDELRRARRLLMLPELVVHTLTGTVTGERTTAGATGLVDLVTGSWSPELLDGIGVEPSLFPPIAVAGTQVGRWNGVPVLLVGGHDTASAVVAMPGPPAPGSAFISSGTWMLVGSERPDPDITDAAREANFSNEPGALGGVRFLKNVMGLWMLERCRAVWGDPPLQPLLDAAERVPPDGPVVDATDERFLAPTDMVAEVCAAAGLDAAAGRDRVVRCVLDSLAVAAAGVISELGAFLGAPVPEVHVLGGGGRNELLNRLLEEACGVPVRVGPVEATALGNALTQGIALGRFGSLDEARAAVAGLSDGA